MECAFQCLVGPLLGLHFLSNAVDVARFPEYSYSCADIVINMIKISYLLKFEISVGFVYSFAIYKHQRIKG